MPRFLDTTTGQFHWVADPATVTYAILSHTWRSEAEGSEQSYEEVRKIWERVKYDRVWREVCTSWSGELSAGNNARDEASFLVRALRLKTKNDLETSDVITQLSRRVKLLEARLFMDTTTATTEVDGESILAHPDLSDKIKGICEIARKAGYQLIWIDSACIDKSSSAELSEAINSMFNLYRLADVCYVYLADVPDGDQRHMAFRNSRWHRRGWTLQELLAPKDVVFLTASWTFLGTKHGLALTLHDITTIDVDVLLGRAPLASVSVACRFSWAAQRETTRVEDEAYSLLGIFGVHLSPIYGEGRNAFLRLQEEIIKAIPDQTIFAWGAMCYMESLKENGVIIRSPTLPAVHNTPTGLLASSAREFAGAGDFRPLSTSEYLSLLAGRTHNGSKTQIREVPPLQSFFTPEGVRIQAYTIDLSALGGGVVPTVPRGGLKKPVVSDDCPSRGRGRARALASLRCATQDGMLVTLALFQTAPGMNESEGLSIATHVKCSDRQCGCSRTCLSRVVCLGGKALHALLKKLSPTPVELSLLLHSDSEVAASSKRGGTNYSRIDIFRSMWALGGSCYTRNDYAEPTPIRLAPSCSDRLAALGYGIYPLLNTLTPTGEAIAQTAIFSDSPASSNMTLQTHIHISLSLTLARALGSSSLGMKTGTRLCLSVHFPRATNQVGGDRLPAGPDTALARGSCECAFYPGGCEAFPLVTDDNTSYTVLDFDGVRLPKRVVAQAEYVVPASLNRWRMRMVRWEDEERRLGRTLRLAVECPLDYCRYDAPPPPYIPDLWLAVDLTDVIEVDRDPWLLQ